MDEQKLPPLPDLSFLYPPDKRQVKALMREYARAALAEQPAASAEPRTDADRAAALIVAKLAEIIPTRDVLDATRNGQTLVAYFKRALAAHKPDGGEAKDAERWRWLRVQPFEVWKRIAWNTWDDDPAVATQRDADIDAAISAQQRQGEGDQ